MKMSIVGILMACIIITTWVLGFIPNEYLVMLLLLFAIVIGLDIKYNGYEINKDIERR